MSAPTTFGWSGFYRALGMKGARIPPVTLEALQPVIVMADLSKQWSAESFSARAFAYLNFGTFVPNENISYWIHSTAPGGIVLEKISVEGTSGVVAVPQWGVAITTTPPLAVWIIAAMRRVDVGGILSTTRASAASVPNATLPGIINNYGLPNPFVDESADWFVAPGSYAVFGYSQWSDGVTPSNAVAHFTWREIPEQQGAP